MKNRYINHAHFSEPVFRVLLRCFCADVTACAAAELCPLSRQAIQRVYSRLRLRVLDHAKEECVPLSGEVEVDESYFGPRRVRGKRGRGAGGKTPVIGLLKRNGIVRVAVIENCSKQAIMPIIRGQVLEGTTVYTDGFSVYDSLVTHGYKHHRIHHHENQFARGKNHVNGIESFWSYAKSRMAKLRGVRREMFVTHLLESAWRFNHRSDDTYRLLLKSCRSNPL